MSIRERISTVRLTLDSNAQLRNRGKTRREVVDKYLLGDSLGRGQFGRVYRAVNSETGEFVAIKQLKLKNLDQSNLQSFEAEVTILQKLKHPNIISYLTCIRTSQHNNLVMEYAEGGSLASVLKKFGPFPQKLASVYVGQTLMGLQYLHENGVIHKDIKGANILLTKNGQVKLADFGIATSEQFDNEDAGFGTPYWMSPEVIEMIDKPTYKADIWSLGCTVIELVAGKPPFIDSNPMRAIVLMVQEDHPPYPPNSPPELISFLEKCFVRDVQNRASAAELLEHPWIVSSLNQGKSLKAPNELAQVVAEHNSRDLTVPPSLEKFGTISSETDIDSHLPELKSELIKIYGSNLSKTKPYKTIHITNRTTSKEVMIIIVKKYRVPYDPSDWVLSAVSSKGESMLLEDDDYPYYMIQGPEGRYNTEFHVVPRPKIETSLQEPVLRHVAKGMFGSGAWVRNWMVIDAEERFIAFFKEEKVHTFPCREEPMLAIFNLRMVRDTDVIAGSSGEFYIRYLREIIRLRAKDTQDAERLSSLIREVCELEALTPSVRGGDESVGDSSPGSPRIWEEGNDSNSRNNSYSSLSQDKD